MSVRKKMLVLPLEGCTYLASLQDDVYIVKNIPYAKLERFSSGGLNIFGLPQDIEPEEGKNLWPEKSRPTINTSEPGPMCLQTPKRQNAYMSAQCQNLQIWAPRHVLEGNKKAPVLFYVHGGSFKRGSNQNPELDGKNMAEDQEIVVVEPNFRIGPLGFIDFSSLADEAGPNRAFYDLLSALRWVQRHIAAFGGDPGNVTLMGESSGGSIVSMFPFITEAQGMFAKLVVLSGIPTAFSALQTPDDRAQRFIDFVGVKDIHELYQPAMWDRISEAVDPFTEVINLGVATYTPMVDKGLILGNAVALMKKAGQTGQTLSVPIWANMTEDELSIMAVMPKIFGRWGMGDMMDQAFVEEGSEKIATMREIYEETYGLKEAQTQIFSDMVIRSALIWYMQFAARCTTAYLTRLDWKSPLQKASKLGSFHSSDLYLLFNNLQGNHTGRAFFTGVGARGRDQVSNYMQADLGRFMREGRLTGPDGQGNLEPFDPQRNLLKSYDVTCRLKPVWPPALDQAWRETNYYQIVTDEGGLEFSLPTSPETEPGNV